MTSKKDPSLMPHIALAPLPNACRTTCTKRFPTLDINSKFSDPYWLDPTDTHPLPYNDPSNTSTPVHIITPINDITEAIPYLAASMYYNSETVLLQLASYQPLSTNMPCHIQKNTSSTRLLIQSNSSPATLRTTYIVFPHHWLTLIQTSTIRTMFLLPGALQMNWLYLHILLQSPLFSHPSLHIQLLQVLQPLLPRLSAHYLHQVLLPVDFSQDYHHTSHLRHHQEHIFQALKNPQ